MLIYEIKVLKSELSTCWYSKNIGNTLYAKENPKNTNTLLLCSEYGISIGKFFLEKEDIEIINTYLG